MTGPDYDGPGPSTVKWANTEPADEEIVMLHSAGRYKEKLISSPADEEADNRERYYYMIDSMWSNSPGLPGQASRRLTMDWGELRGAVLCGVTHPFNPDPRVVLRVHCRWHSRAMTGRISVSQICNCLPAPSQPSVLASPARHHGFFSQQSERERSSSLCEALNVWPFLAFWHCHTGTPLIIYKAEN